jgi:hypothetical protein
MAGSYKHVVADNGNLGSNSHVTVMLENGGDVFEAVEEMYGMIWFLAHLGVAPHISLEEFQNLQYAREIVKDMVETARRNYQEGLKVSKEIHRVSPDHQQTGGD